MLPSSLSEIMSLRLGGFACCDRIGMPSADATALHALAQQCSGVIAAHFVRIGEGGLDVADVAGRGLPRRQT